MCLLIEGWLQGKVNHDHSKEAICAVSKVYLRAHKTDLLKHSKTGTHIRKFKAFRPKSNEEKENDIMLAVFIATHTSLRVK